MEAVRIPSVRSSPCGRDKKGCGGQAISSIAGVGGRFELRLLGTAGIRAGCPTVPPGNGPFHRRGWGNGVSRFIRPSDKVDVVVTANIPRPDPADETVKTTAWPCKFGVLALGKTCQYRWKMKRTDGNTDLAVEPQQANTAWRERGDIRLMLRSQAARRNLPSAGGSAGLLVVPQ